MIGPLDERTPPMTPQLALRVAIIGGLALVMFAVIFFRLWFLQVLSGSQYVAQAQVNIVRDIPVAAPRGEILDSNGTALVESVQVPAIQISPQTLPARIARPARTSVRSRPRTTRSTTSSPSSCRCRPSPQPASYEITTATGRRSSTRSELAPIPCLVAQGVSRLSTRTSRSRPTSRPTSRTTSPSARLQFPGVSSQEVYHAQVPARRRRRAAVRDAQPISCDRGRARRHFKGIEQGNIVGQSGLEYSTTSVLQGINGEERVKVNSANQFEGYGKDKTADAG